ncbi:MAG: glycosyltransferase family 4 protein [Deltaproteobacteria bacterium]|nr:glycosyltransferase family 4 protein [Deltaproteobacteria bacterium]
MTHLPTVCIDCRYIRERPSGITPLVQALVDYLPGLAPDLHFVFLKHPKGPERLSCAVNVREVVVRAEANGPGTMFWLPGVVNLRGIDLYHNTFGVMPHFVRVRTVVMITDIMQVKHPAWAKGPGGWGWIEVFYKRHGILHAFQKATRLVAISQATRQEIASVDAAAAERTLVALEGISPDFHRMDDLEGARLKQAACRRHVDGASRYVLTVGQFSAYKNHERVLLAFVRAFGSEPDIHLVFVQRLGVGPKTLRPIARKLGVESRVHFVHNVPLTDLVSLYNGAMVLCHPSLCEGFGNPPAEAMACGCPVVTSNRSSMPEVAGDAALLVNPEDVTDIAQALTRVASDPSLAASMRDKGIARAATLSWKRFAEVNLEAYRAALAEPSL